jgi:purine catabolism regulator
LCQKLSDVTKRPAAVVDPRFEVMAADPAARASALLKRFKPAQVERHLAVKAELVGEAGNMALRAPIFVTSRLQGYLVLLTGREQPNRFEAMTLEAATLVAAILIAQAEEIDRIRAFKERDAFEALLEGSQDPAKIAALGPLPPGPYTVAVFGPENGTSIGDRRLVRLALAPLVPQARLAEYEGRLVALLPASRRLSPREIAMAALAQAGHARIGLSRPIKTLATMRAAYEEAEEALALGRLSGGGEKVTHADDVQGLLPFLRAIQLNPLAACPRIAALAAHDAAHGSELVQTLETFLDAQQNAACAARALGIHRHTLGYRLGRISDLLGVALSPASALDLRLQLLAHRFAARGS